MNLKEKIKQSETANFLNKANPKILKELEYMTSFLPKDYGTPIRYWYIKNEKTEIETCKCCDKEPKFHGISKGYSLYCSIYCRKEDTKTRHLINQKNKKELDEIRLETQPDDFIKCEICGSAVKLIKNHLLNSHKNWTIENYKKNYPNSQTIAKSTSIKNSENNKGDKNAFSRSKSNEQQRKERSIFSLEWWKLRYPQLNEDELIKLRNESLKDKLKNRLSDNQIEYWTNQGFSEEEAKEKIKERQSTFTLEKCIEKFGEEEGIIRFNERQKKWSNKIESQYKEGKFSKVPKKQTSSRYSKSAKGLFDCLLKEFPDAKCFDNEIELINGNSRVYFDFSVNKKIIEFNGDYWHCHPNQYLPTYFHKRLKMTSSEKWKIDKEKIQLAEFYGYEVLVIWESDYKKNSLKIIKECLEFLNS